MGLTEKEIIVLQLRADGLTQTQIAKKLKISQAAVSDFEKNAKRKLDDARRMLEFAKEIGLNLPVQTYDKFRRIKNGKN